MQGRPLIRSAHSGWKDSQKGRKWSKNCQVSKYCKGNDALPAGGSATPFHLPLDFGDCTQNNIWITRRWVRQLIRKRLKLSSVLYNKSKRGIMLLVRRHRGIKVCFVVLNAFHSFSSADSSFQNPSEPVQLLKLDLRNDTVILSNGTIPANCFLPIDSVYSEEKLLGELPSRPRLRSSCTLSYH